MLGKIPYIFKIVFRQFKTHKKINSMLIASIVFGMIMPIFIIGNIHLSKKQIEDYYFPNIEQTWTIETNADKIIGIELLNDLIEAEDWYSYTILGYDSIPEIKNSVVNINGIDEKYKEIYPSNLFNGHFLNFESKECVIGKKMAKQENLKVGDTLTILGEHFIIAGVTDDNNGVLVSSSVYGNLLRNTDSKVQQVVYIRGSEKKVNEYLEGISTLMDSHTFQVANPLKSAENNKRYIQKYIHTDLFILLGITIFIILNMFIVIKEKMNHQTQFFAISQAMGLDFKTVSAIVFLENTLVSVVASIILLLLFVLIKNNIARYSLIGIKDVASILLLIFVALLATTIYSLKLLKKNSIYFNITDKELI